MLNAPTATIRKRVQEMAKFYMHDKVKCACQGCTKRSVGCHSTCEEYKQFRKSIDDVTSKEREDKLCNNESVRNYAHKGRKKI